MHPIGVLILAVVLAGVLFAPARWGALCMLAAVFYLTQGQTISVGGINMFAFRFVELAGFIRVLVKKEWSWSQLGSIDKALLFLFTFLPIAHVSHSPEESAFAIGQSVDAITCYFAFRGLVRNEGDVVWILKSLVWLLVPYAVQTIIESVTQRNAFAFMGGLNLDVEKWSRGGRLRCQGSFRHGSLMGSVAATFIPLYIGMIVGRDTRRCAMVGVVACVAMVWASNSGAPLNCLAVGLLGWGLWCMRSSMYLVRRTIVLFIVVAALFMKAPIWYLPAKAASLSGGDGWHRSYLMEKAFDQFDVWWFLGCPTMATKDWFPYVLGSTGAADITNQYLIYGLNGGVVAMTAFILLVVIVFKRIGTQLAVLRALGGPDNRVLGEVILWGAGVTVVVHVINWIGISYFDQSYAVWYFQLACIAGLCPIPQPVLVLDTGSAAVG